MEINRSALVDVPHWFARPGDGDYLAWITILLLIAALYGVVYLYAAFDRWAEHKSKGTPLATTIPTLLAIALIYEVFPLDHFHILLPLCAVLVALLSDWSRFNLTHPHHAEAEKSSQSEEPAAPAEELSEEIRQESELRV